VHKSPLVDTSSIDGVQTLFHDVPRDPFAKQLAADLADLFIFSEHPRFIFVRPSQFPQDAEDRGLPPLLNELMRRDPRVFEEELCIVDEQLSINPDYLIPSFTAFSHYAHKNRREVQEFIATRNLAWVRRQRTIRLQPGTVYPVETIKPIDAFQELRAFLNIEEDDLCYVFDVVLRYPLYGGLVDEGEYYMAHPLRAQQNLPTMERHYGELPTVPVRLGPSIVSITDDLTQDEYTSILHEARGLVRELGIVNLRPQAGERERLHELAASLRLPPRLTESGHVLTAGARSIGLTVAPPPQRILQGGR
jgi:hypothetical protein